MDLKRMRRISYIWGIVLFLLVSFLTVIGFVYKNKIKKYEALEEKLESVAKSYVDQNFLYPSSSIVVTYEELKSSGMIDELKVDDEECDGYEVVSHVNNTFKYKAYVKCDNYKTKNYDKNNK